MKIRLWMVGLLLIVLSISAPGEACSSFAVYGEEVIYGMNFDFDPRLEVKFSITTASQGRFFATSFALDNRYQELVGMNEHGLFGTLQAVPKRPLATGNSSTMLISSLFEQALRQARSIQEVGDILGERRLIQPPGFSLHAMFAAPHKNAIIYEAGAVQNEKIAMDGDYIVMTNFYNSDFLTESLGDASAPGGERYRIAEEGIVQHFPYFGLEEALTILDQTSQHTTRSSTVYLPEKGEIYLAIEGDFTKIWLIDIKNATIQAYRGLVQAKEEPLTEQGVTLSALKQWK